MKNTTNTEEQKYEPQFPLQHEEPRFLGSVKTTTLVITMVVSLLFGTLGGYLGMRYALQNPDALKMAGLKIGDQQSTIQTVQVSEESAVVDVVRAASPAVVSIVATRDLSQIPGYGLNPFDEFFNFFGGRRDSAEPNVQQVGAGSGFFISSDGLIVTNRHVVADEQASYTVITTDGTRYDAQVVARDPRNDLAIMKVDIKNATSLVLANSDTLQVGQKVVAIGNSLGQYQNTVTTGVVSGIGRSIVAGGSDGAEELEGVIQTDAAINPGNSGGPLLNITGQVIGINTAIDRQGQLVGFAIPSSDAQKAVNSYQRTGKITRPHIGIRYVQITPALAKAENLPRDYGALLLRGERMTDFAVVPGSPADKAGLAENDIILELDGAKVDENNSLTKLLRNKNVGDTVELKVYSRGSEKTVRVTLEESN